MVAASAHSLRISFGHVLAALGRALIPRAGAVARSSLLDEGLLIHHDFTVCFRFVDDCLHRPAGGSWPIAKALPDLSARNPYGHHPRSGVEIGKEVKHKAQGVHILL